MLIRAWIVAYMIIKLKVGKHLDCTSKFQSVVYSLYTNGGNAPIQYLPCRDTVVI